MDIDRIIAAAKDTAEDQEQNVSRLQAILLEVKPVLGVDRLAAVLADDKILPLYTKAMFGNAIKLNAASTATLSIFSLFDAARVHGSATADANEAIVLKDCLHAIWDEMTETERSAFASQGIMREFVRESLASPDGHRSLDHKDTDMDTDMDIEQIIDAANEKADGLDHEVALLQAVLLSAEPILGTDRLAAFLASEEVHETFAAVMGGDTSDAPKPASLEALIRSASRHGEESEPDHEAGDLIEYLRALWIRMSDDERQALMAGETARELLKTDAPRP